ncbi:hypothetical protein [Microbacterium istanbulense]|uniref:4 TMS phage holin, superfamily IV n=1 Tax=Microbacterium istanbulense TaxID=3122049 RepID=A0ABU8LLD7_9MICO
MITLVFRTLIFVVSAALGLIVADLLLEDFRIDWSQWWGFVLCVVIFAVLQSVLSPWVAKMADRYAPVLMGGIGIFSTLISLIIVVLLPIGGLSIRGASGWLLGSVIVWLVSALGTVLLPMLFLKRQLTDRKDERRP